MPRIPAVGNLQPRMASSTDRNTRFAPRTSINPVRAAAFFARSDSNRATATSIGDGQMFSPSRPALQDLIEIAGYIEGNFWRSFDEHRDADTVARASKIKLPD